MPNGRGRGDGGRRSRRMPGPDMAKAGERPLRPHALPCHVIRIAAVGAGRVRRAVWRCSPTHFGSLCGGSSYGAATIQTETPP